MFEKFFSGVFDEQHEFSEIWELKLIRFDTDLDDKRKAYERYISVSDMIEDVKGNPGRKGSFYLTNLRLLWHCNTDRDLNLSIGLDTINNAMIKSVPIQGYNDVRHVLTIKSISPQQTKYEFKFAGYTQREQKLFKKIQDAFKQYSRTKFYRNIDTTIKLSNSQYQPLPQEECKTRYDACFLSENGRTREVMVFMTNLRLAIINLKETLNYGIPWIMISSFTKTEQDTKEVIQLKVRGILKSAQLYLWCAQRKNFNKMHQQLMSFSQTFNKNPKLGVDLTQESSLDQLPDRVGGGKSSMAVNEIEQTNKVNLGRRKKAYGQGQKGGLSEVVLNEQLGIMMEEMAEGCTRADYWQILRN